VADHQYTFACFLTPYEWTEQLVGAYRKRTAEQGLPEPTPDKFAYLALTYTAETDEEAERDGKGLLWYLYRVRHPYFNMPPGYVPAPALAKAMLSGGGKPYSDSFEMLQEKGVVIAGSPDTMIKKIRYLHERCGIGHLLMMTHAGSMDSRSVRRSLDLFAREVYPAIRDLGEPSPTSAPREAIAV
jgi:alkanesulfonate monooxygenase SsuD/methylene tetrahydromethanopterin reductase-like flavin-dependent oxidoreductase (luciferase family)